MKMCTLHSLRHCNELNTLGRDGWSHTYTPEYFCALGRGSFVTGCMIECANNISSRVQRITSFACMKTDTTTAATATITTTNNNNIVGTNTQYNHTAIPHHHCPSVRRYSVNVIVCSSTTTINERTNEQTNERTNKRQRRRRRRFGVRQPVSAEAPTHRKVVVVRRRRCSLSSLFVVAVVVVAVVGSVFRKCFVL